MTTTEPAEPPAQAPPPGTGKPPATRSHRIWARVLVVLGCLLAIIAGLASWVNRQALDTDEWVDTSTELLQDPAIQTATASYLADQVTDNPNIESSLAQALPPRAEKLAGPLTGLVGEVANRAALRLMRSGEFQTIWETANRKSHEQFVRVVKDEQVLSGQDKAVLLDLRPALGKLAARIGLPPQYTQQLESGDRGVVKLLDSDEITTLQRVGKLLNALPWIATILAILCFTGAVYLSRGQRARRLVAAGFAFIFAGIVLLAAQHVAGNAVVDATAGDSANEAAAESTWRIGTSLLRNIAWSIVLLGALVAIGGWLGTQTRSARWVRLRFGPWVDEHPDVVAGVGIVLLIAALAWLPLPGKRSWVGVLIYVVLAVAGALALHAQLKRERAAGAT
jgi:hypothetical protein